MDADGEVRDHWDSGPLTISAASFHPSSKGYDAYFDALAREADWVDEQVDVFNSVIATAAKTASSRTGADIDPVSVVEQFDNHGACRFWQRDRFVNDAVLGDTLKRSLDADGEVRDHWDSGPLTISAASFHPSSKGYDAYFEALAASVTDLAAPTR